MSDLVISCQILLYHVRFFIYTIDIVRYCYIISDFYIYPIRYYLIISDLVRYLLIFFWIGSSRILLCQIWYNVEILAKNEASYTVTYILTMGIVKMSWRGI